MKAEIIDKKDMLLIPLLEDGTLGNISSIDNISKENLHNINEIVSSIQKVLKESPYAIFLRGSLAYGRFIPGISDVDFVVIVPIKSEKVESQLAFLAGELTNKYRDWSSMIEISVYTPAEVLQPENNRLYMNILLTGIQLAVNDYSPVFPMPILNSVLKNRIMSQTINDCRHTLDTISKRKPVMYMGESRGADFLCVWFMRDLIRGTIAFVMDEILNTGH